MTVSDILDGAFKLMKWNARTIATIVAVFVVPVQLAVAFAQRNIFGGSGIIDAVTDPSVADTATESQSGGDIGITVVATLVNFLLLPFLAGAISKVVAASYLGQDIGPRPALRATLGRFWALLWSWVLVHLLEFSGFVVGGILVVVAAASAGTAAAVLAVVVLALGGLAVLLLVMALSVAVAPAVVVEELGAVQGIRRSWGLMRRRLFAMLGIALLAGLIASILGQVLAVVPTTVAVLIGLRWGWLLLAAGSIIVALVTTPIVAIVATLQYFDARIRFEGFDLEVMAAELARGEPRS